MSGNKPQKKVDVQKVHPSPAAAYHPKNTADEFEVAADLTLYGNPLSCLNGYGRELSKRKEALTKEPDSDGVIIAADLTKYGNPLDDKSAPSK